MFSQPLRVVTVNVNGIRAAVRRGGVPWLVAARPDVLLLQEVRASRDEVTTALRGSPFAEWSVTYAEAAHKGRAGVAVLTVDPPVASAVGFGPSGGSREFDEAGRWVEATVVVGQHRLTFASTYVHAGEAGTPRQAEKYCFLDAITARWALAAERAEHLLVAGDLNVAHREADLKNWKGNVGKSGFLPRERAYFDTWAHDHGVADVHRHLAGPGPGPYTWWSWRGQAFDNDSGWRIDYQLATPRLGEWAVSAWVGRAPSYAERWSDHAPVVVDLRLPSRHAPADQPGTR